MAANSQLKTSNKKNFVFTRLYLLMIGSGYARNMYKCLSTNIFIINLHQVDFSLLNYPTVIFTVLCAYLDTFITNGNE